MLWQMSDELDATGNMTREYNDIFQKRVLSSSIFCVDLCVSKMSAFIGKLEAHQQHFCVQKICLAEILSL
jgi:hypothetical protein